MYIQDYAKVLGKCKKKWGKLWERFEKKKYIKARLSPATRHKVVSYIASARSLPNKYFSAVVWRCTFHALLKKHTETSSSEVHMVHMVVGQGNLVQHMKKTKFPLEIRKYAQQRDQLRTGKYQKDPYTVHRELARNSWKSCSQKAILYTW